MALIFNGTSDYVDVGASPLLQPAAMTVSCWVNAASLVNAYSAIVGAIEAGVSLYQLYIKSDGKLAVYMGTAGAINYDGTGPKTITTDTPFHLAFSYDSVAGLVGYVNGSTDGSAAASGVLGSGAGHLTFGKDTNTPGRLLSGSLSHVSIYNTALSANNIALLASGLSPLTVSAQTLAGYWPLAGRKAELDSGPNGLMATIYGPTPDTDPPFIMPYPLRILSPIPDEGEMPVLSSGPITPPVSTLYSLINVG